MRVRFFAVLSVSALFLAAVAPAAFAQAVIEDDGDDGDDTVQVVDCSQVQQAVANQGQYGDANAAADDESEAAAEVAQELSIAQSQVNACLGQTGGGDETTTPPNGTSSPETTSGTGDDTELPDGEDEVIKETVLAAELPETGGPSLLAAVLGLALVAGGASLIRLRR